MTLDADRRALLERARAEAVLRRCFDLDPDELELKTAPFGVTASQDEHGWIVSMSDDLAILGGVLVWIDRQGADEVDLIVDHHPGIHARRAALLAPRVRVWEIIGEGREATVTRAEPAPFTAAPGWPDDTAALETMLADLGLDVVCEDGIVRGEVAGLEVARIVPGPDGPALEAGVGRFDREAGSLLHAGRSPATAVADALDQVRPHRTRGAISHAINRLARARWLRAELVAAPDRVGITMPQLVEPIPPRSSLLDDRPAALLRTDGDRRVLVVCSVGADLGLIPEIADLIVVHRPDTVRIVVPRRDRLPHLERLVERMPVPTEIRTVSPPWVD